MIDPNAIRYNLESVKARIADAAHRCGRKPEQITLCAVTKTQPIESVQIAVAEGLVNLGENYYQELRDKWDAIPEEVHWHFIGGLQSNKTKYLVGRCATIQSVDSLSLVKEINRRAESAGLVQSVLLEVQLGAGETRSGIDKSSWQALFESTIDLKNVHVNGLMAVAPQTDDENEVRSAMRQMKSMFDMLPLENRNILSMGMTGDFEIAIEEGSNFLRIGSAIFGARASTL
ncbi:MAG: YggS family pyridoxal phosphate-dependent enzyme [Chthonomonadales bacterium]